MDIQSSLATLTGLCVCGKWGGGLTFRDLLFNFTPCWCTIKAGQRRILLSSGGGLDEVDRPNYTLSTSQSRSLLIASPRCVSCAANKCVHLIQSMRLKSCYALSHGRWVLSLKLRRKTCFSFLHECKQTHLCTFNITVYVIGFLPLSHEAGRPGGRTQRSRPDIIDIVGIVDIFHNDFSDFGQLDRIKKPHYIGSDSA